MAYYRLKGKAVASYESCSTAAYRHGRTETIRPATTLTKKCSEEIGKKEKSAAEFRSLIAESSKLHESLIKDAAMGKIIILGLNLPLMILGCPKITNLETYFL